MLPTLNAARSGIVEGRLLGGVLAIQVMGRRQEEDGNWIGRRRGEVLEDFEEMHCALDYGGMEVD